MGLKAEAPGVHRIEELESYFEIPGSMGLILSTFGTITKLMVPARTTMWKDSTVKLIV